MNSVGKLQCSSEEKRETTLGSSYPEVGKIKSLKKYFL